MAERTYEVILEPAEEGGFTAYVPGLRGCVSEGNTEEEALENAKDAQLEEGEEQEVEADASPEQTSYSPDEVLMQKDLASMSDAEVEQARRVIHEIVSIIANRRSRRRQPEID